MKQTRCSFACLIVLSVFLPAYQISSMTLDMLREKYEQKEFSNVVDQYALKSVIDLLSSKKITIEGDTLKKMLAACGVFSGEVSFGDKICNLIRNSVEGQSLAHERACRALLLGVDWWGTGTIDPTTNHGPSNTYWWDGRSRDEIAKSLVVNPSSINNKSCSGKTILMMFAEALNFSAMQKDSFLTTRMNIVEVCKLLLLDNSSLDLQDHEGNTALHIAASKRNKELCDLFMERGASCVLRNAKGETPLDSLVPFEKVALSSLGESKLVSISEAAGCVAAANIGASICHETFLHRTNPHPQRIPMLQNVPQGNNTFLHRAAFAGEDQMVVYILETCHKEIDLNSLNDQRQTPLHLACMRNAYKSSYPLFHWYRADPKKQDIFGNTPFHYVYACGFDPNFFSELNYKHSCVTKNESGWRPLHIACYFGNDEAVKFLLSKSVNVNSRLKASHKTPLMLACERGHNNVCEELLAHGKLKKDAEDTTIGSALEWACEFEHLQVCQTLLQRGFSHQSKKKKALLLRRALQNNNKQLQNLFLRTWEKTLNKQDEEGNTILHIACMEGYKDLVILLQHEFRGEEVGVSLKNNEGKSPAKCAKEKGHTEIVQLLGSFI